MTKIWWAAIIATIVGTAIGHPIESVIGVGIIVGGAAIFGAIS